MKTPRVIEVEREETASFYHRTTFGDANGELDRAIKWRSEYHKTSPLYSHYFDRSLQGDSEGEIIRAKEFADAMEKGLLVDELVSMEVSVPEKEIMTVTGALVAQFG